MPTSDGASDGTTLAVELYKSGLSCKNVGLRVGKTAQQVKTILSKAGVQMRPAGFQKGNYSRSGKQHSVETRLRMSKSKLKAIGLERRDPLNPLLWTYRNNAKKRGLSFELTRQEFELLVSSACYYCGKTPENRRVSRGLWALVNGVDRVDNELGYTFSNCVPACRLCNWMKADITHEEYIEHCRAVARVSGGMRDGKNHSFG